MPQRPSLSLRGLIAAFLCLPQILKEFQTMSAALDRLTASVAKLSETVANLPAPVDDSPALSALADTVDATIDKLAPPPVEEPASEVDPNAEQPQ